MVKMVANKTESGTAMGRKEIAIWSISSSTTLNSTPLEVTILTILKSWKVSRNITKNAVEKTKGPIKFDAR